MITSCDSPADVKGKTSSIPGRVPGTENKYDVQLNALVQLNELDMYSFSSSSVALSIICTCFMHKQSGKMRVI